MKEASAEKTAGVDTETAKANIGKIQQDTKNAALQNEIMQFNKTVEEMNAKFASESVEDRVKNVGLQNNQIENNIKKLVQETEQAITQNRISKETADSVIKQAKLESVRMVLANDILREQKSTQMALTSKEWKAVDKITAEIVRMEEQTRQGDESLDNEAKRIVLDAIRTEFGTGDEAIWIRRINTATNVLTSAVRVGKGM